MVLFSRDYDNIATCIRHARENAANVNQQFDLDNLSHDQYEAGQSKIQAITTALDDVVTNLADLFASANPNFNRRSFELQCAI